MSRTVAVVEIPSIGELDRQSGQLSQQLARALKRAIQRGELKAGDRLPSTRVLAAALGLSRGTVTLAYEQLIAEGFFQAERGAGTRVASDLTLPDKSPADRLRDSAPPPLPARAQRFARAAGQISPMPAVPFAVSVPAGDTLPDDIWRRIGNRIRARGPGAPSGYGEPAGAPELREAIAEYVRKSRSVRCHAGQVIITSGTQQGLYLATQVLLEEEDKAWVEDPAYPGITSIFECHGRQQQMVRVPVDDAGLDVAEGIARCAEARAVFVTPSHQYPLGMPLSMARRSMLINWAKEHRAWIVEDDYDSELRYGGHPFPALQGLAPEQVIYLGTFSKILFPSLRMGYAVVPEGMVDAWRGARMLMDRHPPNADQYVLAHFMREGHLDRHIRRIRSMYAEKRSVLIAAIARSIPADLASVQPGDQGMHLLLWLRQDLDDRQVVRRALASGVSVRAISHMYADASRRPGLILGLGGFTGDAMEQAVRWLAAAIIAEAG